MPKGHSPLIPRNPVTGKQLRGFASMTPEKRKDIAAKGGAAVPASKRSFSYNRELAAEAGAKGGAAGKGKPSARKGRTFPKREGL